MKNIIAPTGYMGSGSSAITDLLSEFKSVDAKTGSFEFVFLHCPDGVFDLEDKLLHYNNSLRSDEALHSFYQTMKDLYNKKYYWVGNYKTYVHEDFMKYVHEFMDEVIQFKPDFYWYYQENTDKKMLFKLILKKLVYYFTFKQVKMKKPLLYPEMWISYIEDEKFYQSAKKFVSKVLKSKRKENTNIVFDQLLLPYNLNRIANYFDDNFRCIVVSRDPRDVYMSNKYYWSTQDMPIPYPLDVHEFCHFYKNMRRQEKKCETKSILRINFEDLIYNYDDTLNKIMKFCDLEAIDHVDRRMKLNPDRSINNTQLFTQKEEFRIEAAIIQEKLSEYIYDFPYERIPNSKYTF